MRRKQLIVLVLIIIGLLLIGILHMPTPRRFQVGTPLADAFAGLNDNFDYIDAQERTRIIRNGNVPTVLEGYQKGGFGAVDYGLKIAKPGIDVTTATDDQLAFSSAFDTLRVVKTGTIDINMPVADGGEGETDSVAHGLSGPKMLVGYVEVPWLPGVFYPLPAIFPDSIGGQIDYSARMHVTATDVVADAVCAALMTSGHTGPDPFDGSKTYNGTVHFRYYLLQETAN